MSSLFEREVKRCLTCGYPACMSACPLSNNFSEIIKYVRAGEFDKAVALIGHPFGEICGYVCPHEKLCQGGCVLGKRDDPILTGTIERELFAQHPYVLERQGTALQGKRYAVVGGGVSGLTFAAKVYEQGADVTVYERDVLLSTVKLIPEFRLPAQAVSRVEQTLCNKFNIVYKQIDGGELKSLLRQFDGVYVSTGLTIDYGLGVGGQALATNYRDCLRGNYTRGTVIVVGGGNSAMDCARFARSQGSKVIVAYRRTEQDMPAFAREIAEARSEGVEFMFNVAPTKLCKDGGKLQLTLAITVNEGRGKLVVTDETIDMVCDSVIAAIGSKFDRQYLCDDTYLGGDANGGKLVVDAVAHGLITAKQIIENARKLCL